MIIGHGIDIVEIDRVNNIYAKYKKQFPKNKIRYYVIGFSVFSSFSVLFLDSKNFSSFSMSL